MHDLTSRNGRTKGPLMFTMNFVFYCFLVGLIQKLRLKNPVWHGKIFSMSLNDFVLSDVLTLGRRIGGVDRMGTECIRLRLLEIKISLDKSSKVAPLITLSVLSLRRNHTPVPFIQVVILCMISLVLLISDLWLRWLTICYKNHVLSLYLKIVLPTTSIYFRILKTQSFSQVSPTIG